MYRVLCAAIVFCASANIAAAQAYVLQVVDSNGMPIADAFVEPVSLSINGTPVRTDKQGRTTIPKYIPNSLFGQATKWISVSKAGYQTTPHLQLPNVWPMKVTLQPGKGGPPPSSFRSSPH